MWTGRCKEAQGLVWTMIGEWSVDGFDDRPLIQCFMVMHDSSSVVFDGLLCDADRNDISKDPILHSHTKICHTI